MCNSCGHRFTTIETSQEDIEAVALEMQRLREQVEQHKSAMQLILNPRHRLRTAADVLPSTQAGTPHPGKEP